jgi:hypothetical protein
MLALALGAEASLLARDPASADDAQLPFALGERVVFRVEWNPPWFLFFLPNMEAGDVDVQLAEELEYKGRKALKIVFQARSSGALASLAGVKIDDQFIYITDAETFCTIEATEKIREGKRKRDVQVAYLPETNRLHVREVDLAVVPNQVKKDEFKDNIPNCVQDVLSALLSLRLRHLKVGMTHRSVLGNADRVKEVEARVEKEEVVNTPMGRFATWRLNTVALLGSLFREGGQFRIWLTADARRLPVQFEAKVHLGKVTGKLKAATLPALPSAKTGGGEKPAPLQ